MKVRTESYFSSWIVRQHFEMPTSSLLCFFPPLPSPDKCGCVHTYTHTHTNTRTHGTPSCRHSMCSNMESSTTGQLLPWMSEWSSDLSSVDMHRRMLFCLWLCFLEVRLDAAQIMLVCLWRNSTKLDSPTKSVVQAYLGAHRFNRSSGLSCPLRCQLHCTSALQVAIAGMQMILYLPYNILSALLYLSQFT